MQKPNLDSRKSVAILKAATELFLKHGYAKTTMDAIARKAKFTKQTVYSYFKNKDILFTQMIVHLSKGHVPASSAEKMDKSKPFKTLLFDVGIELLDLITSPEVLATTRLVIAESDRYPKLAKLYYESGTQQLVQAVAGFLDEENKRGVIAIKNTLSAASYFLSMLKGQYYLRMILQIKPAPSPKLKVAHVQEVVELFIHIYAGKKAISSESVL